MAIGSAWGPVPVRGQVWSCDLQGNGPTDFLIISCDDWNRRRVNTLLGLDVVPGHVEKTRYTSLIVVNGQPMTVYGDMIHGVPRAGLIDCGVDLDARAMADVDQLLDMSLDVSSSTPRPRVPHRPPRHPYRGHVRYADLLIPGEKDKPVVVVSSEGYGDAVEFELVLACQVTSNPNNPHDYDVVLTPPQNGKVVCSNLRSVPISRLRERTVKGGAAVNPADQKQIMTKVRQMVGLS